MVSNPNLQNRPFIIKVKPLAVTASANGTTPSPLCKTCNLPIRARNWFEIAGDYFSSTAEISRSWSSTEKTPSMLLTLSALRCRLPAAIFNESLPTHICIHLMDFVRVCVCVCHCSDKILMPGTFKRRTRVSRHLGTSVWEERDRQ